MNSKYPDWVLKYKRKGTAVHKIGKHFYLYEVSSKWDKELKRARKVTKGYLGIITPEVLKEPEYRINRPTTCKEYGASLFLLKENKEIIERLNEYFPSWWKEIFVLSILRLMHKSPLKHMDLHYQGSWLFEVIKDAHLSKDTLHRILESLGREREGIGFYSQDNIKLSEKEGLRYILPLKRNNNLIDYKLLKKGAKRDFEGYFKFQKRYIWYYRCSKESFVWVFLDDSLKIKEEQDYLGMIETHPELGYTVEKFHQKQHTFGTIALITKLKELPAKKFLSITREGLG